MKKITYILGSFYPAQVGGPNNTIYWQTKFLASTKEFNPVVVTTKEGLTDEHIKILNLEPGKPVDLDGITVYYCNFWKSKLLSPEFFKTIKKEIKTSKLVILTSWFFPITFLSALISKAYNVPFAIAPRGELEPYAISMKGVKKRIFMNMLKAVYKHASFIIATSRSEAENIKKYIKHNIEIIPNYTEIKNINFKIIPHKRHILYLGRIHKKKNIEILIKAYHRLSKKLSAKHNLIIAGIINDKEYYKYLVALADLGKNRNNIRFKEYIWGKEKSELLSTAKVFVLPSHSENFANTVLEALSYATPVITSKNTPWEEIEKTKCGFWIDNNENLIYKKLKYILTLPDNKFNAMCHRAYNLAKSYDIYKKGGKIIRIFNRYAN